MKPVTALAAASLLLASIGISHAQESQTDKRREIAEGPFEPTWTSLAENYQAPDWFRDAKFGIWAHWSAQCEPEAGDWYARHMYLQGHRQYEDHLERYGHPADSGFMEIENLWKAENWAPERLMDLYVRAGAKYFVALANHHDNFDCFDSDHHEWNSVDVGPKKDIVGTWARIARQHGLRFGVSNHSAHSWHWYQAAYAYDATGPRAGERYDAYTLTKEDGAGKWWEGLDPQTLYNGPLMAMPDGLNTIEAQSKWHTENTADWTEEPPEGELGRKFVDTWFLRAQDLVDKYQPDLLYFDNYTLPLGQAGLDVAAHYYNASLDWHDGEPEAVINVKGTSEDRLGAVIDDIERGVAFGIRENPWQTDTCIGDWHYNRDVYEEGRYKSVSQVARMLADIVSKNGNLLLSIPIRGDGTLDEAEIAFLEGLADWMDINGEAIFSTRPWKIYGEGPSTEEEPEAGHYGGAKDVREAPYTAADIRFTTKDEALYAIVMQHPDSDQTITIKALGSDSDLASDKTIQSVRLLGASQEIEWSRDAEGLHVLIPEEISSPHTLTLEIRGAL
ncbi:alpha-L-fucosidase [Pelagicoccus sp. SDUM812003]|uniref:alpha-L-fucosidase n=1 Tax=Pelagicoccus sp. SDUM812003 TaxID=3041267 RepID=UPI00280DEC25|nr:alpha-L-fucosidase [Pelagicoccus sp. SDUM812003]MDQ8202808.1 alpha-L-fucosidase [Pelagicoccus sp. SDUM812003]